jgi:probable rRNA maturation factor
MEIESALWKKNLSEITILQLPDESIVRSEILREAVLSCGRITGKSKDINIKFASGEYIGNLNKEFRDKDLSTDVLTFDYGREADIVLSVEDIIGRKEDSENIEEAIIRTTIHGVLHAFGFDHEDNVDRKIMNDLEDKAYKEMK